MKYLTYQVISMPGATVGETQAAQSSHLATKGEEVEAKSLVWSHRNPWGTEKRGTRGKTESYTTAVSALQLLSWVDLNV